MTYRAVITTRALQDLREIRDFIANQSPDNAERFLEKLLDKLDVIGQSPESFGTAPEMTA